MKEHDDKKHASKSNPEKSFEAGRKGDSPSSLGKEAGPSGKANSSGTPASGTSSPGASNQKESPPGEGRNQNPYPVD